MFEQDATHFFTERPDLVARAYTRFFKQMENDWNNWNHFKEHACYPVIWPYEEPTGGIIIAYPYAASYFAKILCVHSYAAEYESKHRKCPVLISGVRMEDGQHRERPHAFYAFWGFQGKCICEVHSIVTEERVFKAFGLEVLHQQLGHLFASDRFWQVDLSKLRPLEIAELLSQELGIFVGGPELPQILANNCIQKRETMFGSVYQTK